MSLFKNEEIKIDYNAQMKRFSILKNEEWISITHTSFRVMMVMMDAKSDFDRVVVNQQSSHLEIIQILKNFMLEFKCKNFTSIIVISNTTMRAIYNVHNDILKVVNSKNNVYSERSNIQGNSILKAPIIHNNKSQHDDKFKAPLKKYATVNRTNSKRKLDMSFMNTQETKKIQKDCNSVNDDIIKKNQDVTQINNGK